MPPQEQLVRDQGRRVLLVAEPAHHELAAFDHQVELDDVVQQALKATVAGQRLHDVVAVHGQVTQRADMPGLHDAGNIQAHRWRASELLQRGQPTEPDFDGHARCFAQADQAGLEFRLHHPA